MATERSRNVLDATAYSKLCKANINSLREDDYLVTSMDILCLNYKEFLLDVVQQTRRIAKVPLRLGAQHAFPKASAAQCELFAERMVKAMQYVNDKSKSASSCTRLKDGTAQLVKCFLREQKERAKARKASATEKRVSPKAMKATPKKAGQTKKSLALSASRTKGLSSQEKSCYKGRKSDVSKRVSGNKSKTESPEGDKSKKVAETTSVKRKLSFDSPASFQKRSPNNGSSASKDIAQTEKPPEAQQREKDAVAAALPLKGKTSFFDEVLQQEIVISPSGAARPKSNVDVGSSGPAFKRPAASRTKPEAVGEALPRVKPQEEVATASDARMPQQAHEKQPKRAAAKRPKEADSEKEPKNEAKPVEADTSYFAQPVKKFTLTTTIQSLPVRSYVQGVTSDGRRRLLAEWSSKYFPRHADLAKKYKETLESGTFTFKQARELKSRFLKM